MIGVVLSGGQSTRMGRDKGLIELNGKTWTTLVHEKLTTLSIPVFVSINLRQVIKYAEHFEKNDLIIDNSALQIQGPLVGIMSAHLRYPNDDIMVAACDMIKLESIVLKTLVNEYQKKLPEAMAFKSLNIEPLCAVYSSKGLKKVRMQYEQGRLTKHSLMYVLETLDTKYLPLEPGWISYFKNFNQAEDVDEINV